MADTVFELDIEGKTGGIPGAKTSEDRSKLASDILLMIDDSENAKGSLPERWEAVEALYNLDEYVRAYKPHEGAAEFSFPLMTSRLDAMEAGVCNPMLNAIPYFTANSTGEDASKTDTAEKAVHWALDMSMWSTRLRQAAHIAAMCGRSVIRVWFDARVQGFSADTPDFQSYEDGEVEYAAPRVDVIHPKDFVIYPAAKARITAARMVGHMEYMMKREVKEFQRAGTWYNDGPGISPASVEVPGKSADFARTQLNSTSIDADDLIKIYFLTVKFDLNNDGSDEWYECVYAYDTRSLLDIKPYKWSRPGYFGPGFVQEYRTFYPASSPGKKLEQLNLAYNELLNQFYDGVQAGAYSTTFANLDNGGTQDQWLQAPPNSIIATNGAPQVQQISSTFNGAPFPMMLDKLENLADQAIRRPVTEIGGQFKAGTTATAANQANAATAESKNEMLEAFAGNELCAMADFILELMAANADVIKEVYGDSAPWDTADDLRCKCVWEVTGKSPNSNGELVIQKIQGLVGMVTSLGLMDRVDPDGLLMAMNQALDLPNNAKILYTPEELQQNALAQQQLAEQAASFGPAGIPGMEDGGGVPFAPPPQGY